MKSEGGSLGIHKNVEVVYMNQEIKCVFFQFEIIMNVLKCLFPLHMNTYVMDLRSL